MPSIFLIERMLETMFLMASEQVINYPSFPTPSDAVPFFDYVESIGF